MPHLMPTSPISTEPKTLPTWAVALRQRRKELKLTQEQIAALAGDLLAQRTISNLENGRNKDFGELGITKMNALARALNWTLDELQRETGASFGFDQSIDIDPMEHIRAKTHWSKIQRIGVVNAGNSDVYELAPIGEYDDVPEQQLLRRQCKLENCYTYLVNGDSMVSDGTKTHKKAIAHGDIIVIERFRTVQKDDLVVFWDKTEQKMLVKAVNEGSDDGYMVFRSFNSSFPPIVRHESDVKIYGVVVWRGG
jgi:transcriptional regulator with XRE-family HTH domain